MFLNSCSPKLVLQAGFEQVKFLINREDISKVISDENRDPALRVRLESVLKARAFAKELGLETGSSYTTYVDVQREVLIWVMTANPEFSLQPYTWWFPIVGSVPYRGYYNLEEGTKALQQLREKHYDVSLRPAPAYSTLGWFSDPVYSTMVFSMGQLGEEEQIVQTIFHELTHQNVWIPGSVSFNESLAEFISYKIALQYYRKQQRTDLLEKIETHWNRNVQISMLLQKVLIELETLFKAEFVDHQVESSELNDVVRDDLRAKKQAIIAPLADIFLKDLPEEKREERRDTINLAFLSGLRLYMDRYEIFANFFEQCDGNIGRFFQGIKSMKQSNTINDPYQELNELSCPK